MTMRSFDGAELCELVGIYILCSLAKLINKEDCGFYRDDGLLILWNVNGQQIHPMPKNIIKTFKDIGVVIDVETKCRYFRHHVQLKQWHILTVRKAKDLLLYISKSSSHPLQIINQLPKIINERLSRNSPNEEVFNPSKYQYEKALRDSGYTDFKLKFNKTRHNHTKGDRQRRISTNVGKKFLQLLRHHFPPSNKLHKIFDNNTVKVSYFCTQNVASIIKSHNK